MFTALWDGDHDSSSPSSSIIFTSTRPQPKKGSGPVSCFGAERGGEPINNPLRNSSSPPGCRRLKPSASRLPSRDPGLAPRVTAACCLSCRPGSPLPLVFNCLKLSPLRVAGSIGTKEKRRRPQDSATRAYRGRVGFASEHSTLAPRQQSTHAVWLLRTRNRRTQQPL